MILALSNTSLPWVAVSLVRSNEGHAGCGEKAYDDVLSSFQLLPLANLKRCQPNTIGRVGEV
jgi:hypothetical protein